jgi:hypothetical protein
MHVFFRGWRRKVGGVTLVMALAFAGLLVRSISSYDAMFFGHGNQQQLMISFDGILTWYSYPADGQLLQFKPMSTSKHAPLRFWPELYTTRPPKNDWQLTIQYWWFATPLTLLSAYLILWKPQRRA